MTIQFGSDPNRADELLETVFDGIRRLQEDGPTDVEMADAQEALRRQFETDFQENRTWLSQLVSDYQRGEVPGASVGTYLDSIDGLTADFIQAAAGRYFDSDNFVRVTLLPE